MGGNRLQTSPLVFRGGGSEESCFPTGVDGNGTVIW